MRIRYRNIVRDENNIILSGSAAIVENRYSKKEGGTRLQNHTKQKVVERLGKVVWMDEADKNCGIFNSPQRGLVFYDLVKDEFTSVSPSDERLIGTSHKFQEERIHTSFGNCYLFFSEMEKTPYMTVLRNTFEQKMLYKKILAHVAHDCLKNRSSIGCGDFLKSSVLSYILTDIPMSTLNCDSSYYYELSDDNLKTRFFKSLVNEMRKTIPEFGRGCYVDSTPLPGEAENNPFNALCSHGTDGLVIQSRLVLVLDIQTDIPIWFEIIPSNVLDKSTILSITKDVKVTLDIDIDMYDLDAGYARRELFELFNRGNNTVLDEEGQERDHTVLVRMPATNGYPRDELYLECKPHFYQGKYSFDYEHHTFFGERIEVSLFGYPEYAFVFVDKTQAESLLRGWREQHLSEWEGLSDSAQDWYQVKDGFFVLVGNKDQSPKEALLEYRGRARIEGFFRDAKTYLKILPIGKWNMKTVKGKIFHDIIETIFYRAYRQRVAASNMSLGSLIVTLDSWECFKCNEDLLELKTPNTQVRELLESLGYTTPGHMSLAEMRNEILEGIPMERIPVTMRTKRASHKTAPPISPEEKLEERDREKAALAKAKADLALAKAEGKAKHILEQAEATAKKKKEKAISKAERRLSSVMATAKRDRTKEKALEVYDLAVANATVEYDQRLSEARARYESAMADAKAAYVSELNQCSNSDG